MFVLTLRRFAALGALAALATTGCAEERDPINRVQANALAKTFFVGESLSSPDDNPEFYYRPTLVDVDYGASQEGLFTATYAQTLSRIAWEITEDVLNARLTYERISGSSGFEGAETGQLVASFRIQSHFDIKRAYNPQTGEQLNVVEENASDRAWYEREYFRVDWSQNLITSGYDLDTLAALKAYSDSTLQYEPLAYYVEDPNHPDAPVFDVDERYFDVTNKVFATPQVIESPFGTFPACFFTPDFFGGSGPTGNCNAVELKIRHSFRQIEDTDYEPIHWDGTRQDMFGFFTTGTLSPERYEYDRKYGVVDDQWYRFAARYNLWEKSHATSESGEKVVCFSEDTTPAGADPNRDENGNATDDECEGVGLGSRCDRFNHACTIPYRDRTTRAHAWYYGPGSDPTVFESVNRATKEWDGAMRHAVQTGRYSECVSTRGVSDESIADCKDEFSPTLEAALEAVPEIIVLCHNPVVEGDHEACGEADLAPRVGDLRYHMVNIIQNPQTPSPWGILADANDPLTGEVIAASINVWNHVTDLASQGTVDLMRWFLGELSNRDVIDAQYLSDWLSYTERDAQGVRNPPLMTDDQIQARLAAMDRSLDDGKTPAPKLEGTQEDFMDWAAQTTRAKFGDAVLGSGNTPIQTRLAVARGSAIEAELLTEPYLEMGGLSAKTPIDETAMEAASPLRGNFIRNQLDIEHERQVHFGQIGRCMLAAPEPSSVGEWAKVMARKFPLADTDPGAEGLQASVGDVVARNQKWFDYIRRAFTFGVVLHEMGHSVGLRHVFTSSYDAINFRPQYWQLRTSDGRVSRYCGQATADGTSCVGPRWYDPVTDEERTGMIWAWQHTSVMDYPGDVTQDILGIGAYDRAAIRFGYTNTADIWDDPDATRQTPAGALLADRLDSFGGIGGPWYGFPEPFHYSRLNEELGLVRGCRPSTASAPEGWDDEVDGEWDPVLDGLVVNGTECDGPDTDHVQYRSLYPVGGESGDPAVVGGVVRKFDALDRVRRPYLFASDEYADLGNVAVFRHDNGADAYEIAHFFVSQYEDRHIFDNYRRNRTAFSIKGAVSRGQGRYNEKLKEMAKGFGLFHDILQGAGAVAQYTTGQSGDGLLKANALATGLIFDHFARMLTRPSSSTHYLTFDSSGRDERVLESFDQLLNVSSGASLDVPEGSTGHGVDVAYGGRPVNNALDDTKGYYATQYDTQAGSYYDKTLAIQFLTESVDRFISQSRDDFVDGRYRNISFASVFPDGVRRLIATALTGDVTALGWRAPTTVTGAIAKNSDLTPSGPLGWRVWWMESGPGVCWPTAGQEVCHEFPTGKPIGTQAPPPGSVAIDPQVGWEVQKFIIFWTLLYLPENWKKDWVDLMRLWVEGDETYPGFAPAETVVWRDPVSGQRYIAHSHGKESLDGRSVDRGIAARTLEWANTLTRQAYEVESEDPATGEITVRKHVDDSNCSAGTTYCTGQPVISSVPFVARLSSYKSVLDYMRTVASSFGFFDPEWRGVYQ